VIVLAKAVALQYRSLRPDEVSAAADVFLVSIVELARSHGLPAPTGYTRASVEPAYEHLRRTGIFEVAVLDGKIVGIAAAIVRDSIWFLAMFWVLPEYKQRGLGRPLLERVRELGVTRGAKVFCTWSSIDFAAVASYLKLGLLPAGPIFTFSGRLNQLPNVSPAVRGAPLEPAHASAIDQIVRGTPRSQDHAFLVASGARGIELEIDGKIAGYYYVQGGAIGPAAWLDEQHAEAVLEYALRDASIQTGVVKLVALGLNETAVRLASAYGLRLVGASHWLRSEPFGRLNCYVPSGPALF